MEPDYIADLVTALLAPPSEHHTDEVAMATIRLLDYIERAKLAAYNRGVNREPY